MKHLYNFFYMLGFGIFFLFLIEIFLQIYMPAADSPDKIVGWKLKKNFVRNVTQTDSFNNKYEVNFRTNEFGVRTNLKYKNPDLKVLVLGDSFTGGAFASNTEMWFSIFADEVYNSSKLKMQVWASGSGGYSSFQEYLIAKEIKNYFNPDVLILQFCENDYINNYWPIEIDSIGFITFIRRPYYDKSLKNYRVSHPFSFIFNSDIIMSSRIFNITYAILEKYFISSIDYKKYEKNLNKINNPNHESVKLTLEILVKIKKLFKNIPSYITNCNPPEKIKNWNFLVENSKFIPLLKPPYKIQEIKKENKLAVMHKDGGHWSNIGNRIFGKELAKEFLLTNDLNKIKNVNKF